MDVCSRGRGRDVMCRGFGMRARSSLLVSRGESGGRGGRDLFRSADREERSSVHARVCIMGRRGDGCDGLGASIEVSGREQRGFGDLGISVDRVRGIVGL